MHAAVREASRTKNVFLQAPSGTHTVTVDVANLPDDGVPFFGDGTDQDFALVFSNATLVAA